MARSKSYTLLTPDIIDELKHLQVKTVKKPHRLLRGKQDKPADLTAVQISNWLTGKAKSAKLHHIDYALDLYRNEDTSELCSQENLVKTVERIKSAGMLASSVKYRLQSCRFGGLIGSAHPTLENETNFRP